MRASRVAVACLGFFAMSVGTVTIGRAAGNAGEQLYQNNCMQCHGAEGRGGKAPKLVPFKWSDREGIRLVREPECDMPPIPESDLSDEAVAEIIGYLKTLK